MQGEDLTNRLADVVGGAHGAPVTISDLRRLSALHSLDKLFKDLSDPDTLK